MLKEQLLKEMNDWEKRKEEYNIELINNIKKYKKVILYGTTECAVETIKFLKENGIAVDAIYDDDLEKENTLFYDIPVIRPDITCQDKNIAIILTMSYYETIRNRFILYDENIERRLFMYDGLFLENIDINFFKDNIDKIFACYSSLEDKKSKDIFLSLIKYRYIRDINIIKDLYESRDMCYFDEVFLNKFKDGLYVDAGSYNADFITNLAKLKDISQSEFYIFEPNKEFNIRIRENLKDKYNYKLFDCALCDVKDIMEFRRTKTSTSHLWDAKYNAYKGTLDEVVDKVNTDTLDNILKDKKVRGIKVDIEGSEAAMIRGAVGIIKRDRPFIMLSIYHRASDLFELQYFLNSLNLDYKFYIRHYSLSVAKSILYCIPND